MNTINFESLTEWKPIGLGQFGEVYKVKDKELNISLAVKKLKGNVSQHFNEFLQEAEKFKHASTNLFVTQLVGIIEKPEPCIVMELMEYGSLGTLIENVRIIPWALKYRILHEVAIGMNWLHSLALLHLDLKPKNVLLNDGLHIRITDFGLSKYTCSSAAGGDNEGIGGTLEYMPPEAFQEGYKPSKSTDIYSFAILSAVVLRGEDPYPVQISAIISYHVPRGERPSFESLESIDDVKNLDKAIDLSKQCWDNDMHQRPSFHECCTQWEMIKSAYEDKEIRDAVRAVQNIMDCPDSSGSTTDVPQTASSVSANTNYMSAMIKQLETIDISEAPSVKQKSVPVMNPNSNYSRSPVQNVSPINQQWTMGHQGHYPPSNRTESGLASNPTINQNHFARPLTSSLGPGQYRNMPQAPRYGMVGPGFTTGYNFQPFSRYRSTVPPVFPMSPTNNITVSGNTTSLQFGNRNTMFIMGTNQNHGKIPQPLPWPPNRAPSRGYSPQPQIPGFNITINGNTDGLQVGDNNEMVVMGSSQHTGLNTKPVTPHSGQTVHTNFPSPAQCAPPTTTSQVRLSTQARDAFPGSTQSMKETARLNNQPDQTCPPAQAADRRLSLQSQNPSNLSNTQTEHVTFVKPIQEVQNN